MSTSATDLEAMDRDELERELRGMDRRLSNLQEHFWEDVKPQLETLQERVDDLEAENQRLQERLDENPTKRSKVAAIVRYADNAREEGQPAIKLTAKEIAGAADISRRYGYDLMDGDDGLPGEYDWFLTPEEMRQYGSLELEDTDERRLGVDFEGVHSTGVPLNKFNNEISQGGGE